MDPRLKSILTSFLAVLLGSVATWLVKNGIITADQTSVVVDAGVGAIFALGTAAVVWLKSREHTPAAQMTAITNMSVDQANAAVDSLPTTAKNEIKLATLSPATIVNAAASLPEVAKIEVAHDAGFALSAVAEDPGQPKVVTQGSKP